MKINSIEQYTDMETFQPLLTMNVDMTLNFELLQDMKACYPLDGKSEIGRMLVTELMKAYDQYIKKEG
jgi:hypothetical protein